MTTLSFEARLPAGLALIGHGASIAHHGEILQGVFEDGQGLLHRGLVTLPCALLRSVTVFQSSRSGELLIDPPWKTKALAATRCTLTHLGCDEMGGQVRVITNVPLCWGLGSSTSDVVATIRAVACAFHAELPPETVAALAVESEVASDSMMFEDRAILFGQREGLVLEDLAGCLPALEVVGVNADADGISTLHLPLANYSHAEVESFRTLRSLLRRAVVEQDARLLGAVASESARINQRHLAKPRFDQLEKLVESVGALGLQVAHSGTVVGLLFAPADREGGNDERIEVTEARLRELGFTSPWRFETGRARPIGKRGWRRPSRGELFATGLFPTSALDLAEED